MRYLIIIQKPSLNKCHMPFTDGHNDAWSLGCGSFTSHARKYNISVLSSSRVGWTRACERVLHTFSSLSPVAKVHDFQLCIIAKWILLLNSGGSVVQLDITDSGPRPHASPLRI